MNSMKNRWTFTNMVSGFLCPFNYNRIPQFLNFSFQVFLVHMIHRRAGRPTVFAQTGSVNNPIGQRTLVT